MGTRPAVLGKVRRTERLTPHTIRVVLGGKGLKAFRPKDYTDSYVKVLIPPPGAGYTAPYDLKQVRARYPKSRWPAKRTYTVRSWNPDRRELSIDVVVHGDGVGGPWATTVQPGERVQFMGPGGSYRPDRHAGWHLFVGDETSLPAIAVALERLPADTTALVFVEIAGPEDEQQLATSADASVVWVHRDAAEVVPGRTLVETVRRATFPPLPADTVHAFVHGESGVVKDVRRHLRDERQVPKQRISASGYWRRGRR